MLIAVADDDTRFTSLFFRAVQEMEFVEARFATSGRELIGLVRETMAKTGRAPQVIFIDIRMETESAGFDALEKLRSDDRTRGVPIIVMSSSDLQIDIDRSFSSGANAFIHKPVGSLKTEHELKKHLSYWLKTTQLPSTDSRREPISVNQESTRSTLRMKSDSARRGSAYWALDRARQDILVALVIDLASLEDISLPLEARDELMWVVSRFSERFAFRNDVFDERLIKEMDTFRYLIKEWLLANDDLFTSASRKRKVLAHIRQIRRKISEHLRFAEPVQDNSRHDQNLARGVLDDFSGFAARWVQYFPHLSISLKRYEKRLNKKQKKNNYL